MADFSQTGSIATLHRLDRPNLERLERGLSGHSMTNPMALVLPCLYSELRGPALGRMFERERPYLADRWGTVEEVRP